MSKIHIFFDFIGQKGHKNSSFLCYCIGKSYDFKFKLKNNQKPSKKGKIPIKKREKTPYVVILYILTLT